jgi:hypothetical protein
MTVIPAAPKPLITLPRMTCDIDDATPLKFDKLKFVQIFWETYTTPHPILKRT